MIFILVICSLKTDCHHLKTFFSFYQLHWWDNSGPTKKDYKNIEQQYYPSIKIDFPTVFFYWLSFILVLQKDILYWGIDELTMEPCCALKYYPEVDVLQSEKDGDIKQKQKILEQVIKIVVIFLLKIFLFTGSRRGFWQYRLGSMEVESNTMTAMQKSRF